MVYSLIMSFLVTGGTGFIGSYVVHNLLQHGQRVVCLDRFPNADVVASFPPEVGVTEGDVSDRRQVAAVFGNYPEMDHIVHLAYVMGAESEADPLPAGDWNCYTYVKDLAEEIYRLTTKPTLACRIYNSGGHALRAADLAGLVRAVIPEAQISFHPDRPNSPFIYRMDRSRIQREINYPLRSLSEGIQDHVASAKKSSIARRLS
jgi:nucleoside-diphosphate-sugar epimerase